MQALLQADAPAATFPLASDSRSSQGLASHERQALGERLRRTYALVEAPLPARLAELVERLARREQAGD
jgi:hypothetical protein